MHTKQQTLEISGLAIVARDRPGSDPNTGFCRFALGCAAGVLLSAEECEDCDLSSGFADAQPAAGYLDQRGHDPAFVRELQNAHDDAAFGFARNRDVLSWRRRWLMGVQAVAEEHTLDFAPILAAAREAGWEVDA